MTISAPEPPLLRNVALAPRTAPTSGPFAATVGPGARVTPPQMALNRPPRPAPGPADAPGPSRTPRSRGGHPAPTPGPDTATARSVTTLGNAFGRFGLFRADMIIVDGKRSLIRCSPSRREV